LPPRARLRTAMAPPVAEKEKAHRADGKCFRWYGFQDCQVIPESDHFQSSLFPSPFHRFRVSTFPLILDCRFLSVMDQSVSDLFSNSLVYVSCPHMSIMYFIELCRFFLRQCSAYSRRSVCAFLLMALSRLVRFSCSGRRQPITGADGV